MTATDTPQPCPPVITDVPGVLAASRALLGRITRENRRVDVTDALTPGARAAAVQRANVAAHATGQVVTTLTAQWRDQHDATLRAAFDGGRAYERGAAVRRLIGKTPAARERRALDVATTYLTDGDPRGAVLVLAGYTGTEV